MLYLHNGKQEEENPMITVIGSINVDMVTTTALVPEQGQTVAGKDFQIKPGDKGANQAVAAARLGADVNMIGKVGQDAYGEEMLRVLTEENDTASMVEAAPGVSTGTANIIVSNQDNRIIVVPGANHEVTPAYVERFTEEILKSDLVLVQFEIPMETIRYILDLCSKHKIPVVVNPAPAAELPDEYSSFGIVLFRIQQKRLLTLLCQQPQHPIGCSTSSTGCSESIEQFRHSGDHAM